MTSGNLWIGQSAGRLADKIHRWSRTLSKEDYWTFGSQLMRSADSVAANLLEGFGRKHIAESLHFYSISRGSLEETIGWIRRSHARNVMTNIKAAEFIESYLKLNFYIVKYVRHLEFTAGKTNRLNR